MILVLDYFDVTSTRRHKLLEELTVNDFRYPILQKIYEAHGVVIVGNNGERRIYKNHFGNSI